MSPAGVLTIGVSTAGAGAPPPMFSLTVDSQGNQTSGARAEPIKSDGGIVTFRDLGEGAYVVVLTLPSRCTADGGTRRQVVVNPRRTTALRFNVSCRYAARGASPAAFDERASRETALRLVQIQAVFSLVAPCPPGASLVSVLRATCTTDC